MASGVAHKCRSVDQLCTCKQHVLQPKQLSANSHTLNLMVTVPAGCLQTKPRVDLPADKARALTARIQDAGTEVVKAKARPLAPPKAQCGDVMYITTYLWRPQGHECQGAAPGAPTVQIKGH